MNGGNRDKTFFRILVFFGVLMCVFGLVAIILVAWGEPSEKVAFRIINAMGAMFTGMLGLALGWLSARGSNGK